MKRTGKYALIAVSGLALVFLLAILVANHRYDFLFAGPRVSHESLMTGATRLRVVAQPPLAKPLIAKLLGGNAPPPWILDRVVPYEAALLAAPDVSAGRLDVTLFLNPQRLAPVIAEAADAFGVPQRAPYMTWTTERFDASKRGVLRLDGIMSVDFETVDAVKAQWGEVFLPGQPPFEGGHLVELSLDNRDGSAYALLSMFANRGLLELPMPLDSLRKTVVPMGTFSLTADLVGDDELTIRMTVECQPNAEEGQVTGLSFMLGGIYSELVKTAEQRGAILSGAKQTVGTTISGQYSLKNISVLI